MAWAASTDFPPKEITMGVPYNFSRNQALVEYNEILNKAFNDIGYKLVIVRLPIQNTHEMLIEGKADSVPYDDLSDPRKRNTIVTTSFPIVITAGTVFYAKVRPIREDRLGKYRGSISTNNTILIKEAKHRKLKFSQTSSPYHCIQTILEKKADYCVTIREVGLSTIDAIPEAKGKVVALKSPFITVPVHVSMQKKFSDEMPKLEDALRRILQGDLEKYPALKPVLNSHP